MPVPVTNYGTGPSCWDKIKWGFTMGFCVGLISASLFGGFTAYRSGLRGKDYIKRVGELSLQTGGSFGIFMAVGHGLRC